MKISTQFNILQAMSIGTAIVLGAVIVSATDDAKREVVKNEMAQNALRGVVALRYLMLEYILHHEERSKDQWQMRNASLARALARYPASSDSERTLVRQIEHARASADAAFSQIVDAYAEAAGERSDVLQDFEAMLTAQILTKGQVKIADALALADLSRTAVLNAQRRVNVTLAAGGIALLAIIGAMFFMVSRGVLRPLEKVRLGTQAVSGGNLAYRLGMTSRNEIGDLARDFDEMTQRLDETTVARGELVATNASLQSEIAVREGAERNATAQIARLNLLHRITRAIGSREDVASIVQVVVGSLEDELPVDFACVCRYDATDRSLTVAHVGPKGEPLASELAARKLMPIDLSDKDSPTGRQEQLLYHPDLHAVSNPFFRQLAHRGLGSMIMAPLKVETTIFGALMVGRRPAHAFSKGDADFLQQLGEHVALAWHQAELSETLHQAFDELSRTQQRVMQQDRLRIVGRMASGIAHDINNALSPVALYTETLLAREANLSDRARGYLEIIQRAVDDVSQTVARLREFYRQHDSQPTLVPVALNLLAQQVIDLTKARWSDMAIRRGVTIDMHTELAAELPAILGIESEIREALTNVILNAVDAVSKGGVVTVRTRRSTALDQPYGVVQVEVEDNGPGMDEETRQRCLEPFFTTKGERGTGLGLAMVYGTATRHGADIDVISAPGKGTTVRLSFPALDASAAASAAPRAPPAMPPQLRLLIVDDDPILLKSLSVALENDGHVVVTADGGKAGIEAFRQAHEHNQRFDAVITDLGMPNVDGRRVAAAIRQISAGTPVILLTGWGQRLVADGDIPQHVDRVLSKPPKMPDLRAALAALHVA